MVACCDIVGALFSIIFIGITAHHTGIEYTEHYLCICLIIIWASSRENLS